MDYNPSKIVFLWYEDFSSSSMWRSVITFRMGE